MEKLFEIYELKCSYDKSFKPGQSKVVLDINHLVLPKGKIIFIVGESGIGKSTILEVLGVMNNTIIPSEKTQFFFFDEHSKPIDILQMWRRNQDNELSEFRLKHFNFIFQNTNLMPNFTAFENISITKMLQGYSQKESFKTASELLQELGLSHIDEARMAKDLSGGQQQRLAFARAILPNCTVLFGDEPTGNLDSENAMNAMKILSSKVKKKGGCTAIIVSHDMHLAVSHADVIIKVKKRINPNANQLGDLSFCGVLDDSCVYTKMDDGFWSNTMVSFDTMQFETFLKSK